jgi:hypothetical protein
MVLLRRLLFLDLFNKSAEIPHGSGDFPSTDFKIAASLSLNYTQYFRV